MNAPEVVPREVNRDRCRVILNLLTEGIRQPSKSPHRHAHRKVRPLNVGRADVFRIGAADHFRLLATDAHGGAVTRGVGTIRAIDFVKDRVIDIARKGIDHSIQVNFQTIRGQLHAVRETA